MKINDLLIEAVRLKASDIHITVGVPVMVRLRGELVALNQEVMTQEHIEELVKELRCPIRLFA